MFDKDNDGGIDLNEFKNILYQGKIDMSIWNSMINEVDEDGNGEIDYEEFKEMMLK